MTSTSLAQRIQTHAKETPFGVLPSASLHTLFSTCVSIVEDADSVGLNRSYTGLWLLG